MPVRTLCAELLAAWRRAPGSPDALEAYIAAQRPLLTVYNATFGPGGDVAEAFRRRWAGRADEARRLADSLRDDDLAELAALADAGLQAAAALLQPHAEPEVVLLLGLGWSNACALLADGRPVAAVSVEAWTGEFFGARLERADLPLWVAHEVAHLVRYTEGSCALADFYAREGFDYGRALAALPLREFLVDEGLATAVGYACAPEGGIARALGFDATALAWCRRHEALLWAEVAPRLEAPPGSEGFARWFSAGGPMDGDDGRPTRCGYYLGWRMVEAHLADLPRRDLAAAVRAPAEAFAVPAGSLWGSDRILEG